jgi:hypothetical protein
MKKAVPALVLTWLLAVASETHAYYPFGWCSPPCAPVYCPPPVCYKVEMVPVKCTVLVPRVIDVPKTVTVCIPVPREDVRNVHAVKYVPVPCVDCCGCTVTCMQPQCYVAQVRCMVWDYKYEPRQIMCKSIVYDQRVVEKQVCRLVAVPCATPAPSGMMPGAKY